MAEKTMFIALPGYQSILGHGEVQLMMKPDDQGFVKITAALGIFTQSLFLTAGQCRALSVVLAEMATDAQLMADADATEKARRAAL